MYTYLCTYCHLLWRFSCLECDEYFLCNDYYEVYSTIIMDLFHLPCVLIVSKNFRLALVNCLLIVYWLLISLINCFYGVIHVQKEHGYYFPYGISCFSFFFLSLHMAITFTKTAISHSAHCLRFACWMIIRK